MCSVCFTTRRSRILLFFLVVVVLEAVLVVHSFQLGRNGGVRGLLVTRIYLNSASVSATELSTSSSSSSSSIRIPDPSITTVVKSGQKNKEADGVPSSSSSSSSSSIFDEIAQYAGLCLLESDLCRDAINNKPANQVVVAEFGVVAKGATNWIDDASSLRLHHVVNRVTLNPFQANSSVGSGTTDRDDAMSWMRWIKSIPCPTIMDLTSDFQRAVALSVHQNPKSSRTLHELLEQDVDDFLQRFACRIILLPSGTMLSSPLVETSSSLIHGKLLYGGVTRSRLLQRQQQQSQQPQQQQQQQTTQQQTRLVGERQAVKTNVMHNVEAWTMFGGPPRMYQALDMGPAAVLEVLILPRGTSVQTDISTAAANSQQQQSISSNQNMILTGVPSTTWAPQKLFTHYQPLDAAAETATVTTNANSAFFGTSMATRSAASTLYGRQRNEAFRSGFQSTVGGLQPQIDSIVRRVLDGRIIRPADNTDNDNNNRININDGQQQHINGGGGGGDNGVHDDDLKSQERNLSMASLEAQELELLGLTPVRGLLLYGPPGCGESIVVVDGIMA
jgi:hypothetical protein